MRKAVNFIIIDLTEDELTDKAFGWHRQMRTNLKEVKQALENGYRYIAFGIIKITSDHYLYSYYSLKAYLSFQISLFPLSLFSFHTVLVSE
jgi:hypothetical protein